MDKIAEISLLYDFYGQLLTRRQREVMEFYHEENYSLAEIAEEFSISRQGVHDALKSAEKALAEYEQKLGLVEKLEKSRRAAARIDRAIDGLLRDNEADAGLKKKLEEIKNMIDEMEL